MSTDLVAQTEQQLFALYDQRDQLEQQQQQLMQYTPDYQNIHIDNPAQVEQFYKQNAQLKQNIAQQMQNLNTNIAVYEDRLSHIEKEAMSWVTQTGRNERREIRRTQDGIIAESTSTLDPQLNTPPVDTNKPGELKKSDEALITIGSIAFVMLIIAALIKLSFQIIENNPEASAVLLMTLIGLFLIFKKGDK